MACSLTTRCSSKSTLNAAEGFAPSCPPRQQPLPRTPPLHLHPTPPLPRNRIRVSLLVSAALPSASSQVFHIDWDQSSHSRPSSATCMWSSHPLASPAPQMESSAHSLHDSPRNRSEEEALPADFRCDALFAAANRSAHRSKSDPLRHPSTTPSSHTHRGRSHFRFLPS